MGNESSRLSVSSTSEVINKTIQSTKSDTIDDKNIINTITIKNSNTGDISQSIEAIDRLESICNNLQNVNDDNSINQKLENNLKQSSVAIMSDMGAILVNKGKTLETEVKDLISNTNITDVAPLCISNQNLVNSIVIEGSNTKNIKQIVSDNFVEKCVTSVKSVMNNTSNIINTINQKASITEENPLDFLSKMFSGIFSTIIIIIIVILGAIVMLFSGSGGSKNLQTVSLIAASAV